MRPFLPAVLLLLLGLGLSMAGVLYTIPELDPLVRRSISGSESMARGVLLYAAMLLGMLSTTLYDALDTKSKLITSERLTALGKAAIASPIVFFCVYKIAQDHPDGAVSLLLAFQNGFFWETVFVGRTVANTHRVLATPQPKDPQDAASTH